MAAKIDDALMIREGPDGSWWDVIRIPVGRIGHLELLGWNLLISSTPTERDIHETFAADVARFNPPRKMR